MKVYLLSHGEYSSWSIDGIFSSLEALEKGKAKLIEDGAYNNFNDHDEYDVDELLSREQGPTWSVSIYCQTGEMVNSPTCSTILRHPRTCIVTIWVHRYRHWVISVRSPISREHAEKIAVEKRQEWLRVHAMTPKSFSEEIDI